MLPKKKAEPLSRNYHWHPAFDNYPVVNITHEAAEEFCKWLTKPYQLNKGNKNIRFRLPTIQEMNHLMKSRSDLLGSDYHEDYDCKFVGNLKYKNRSDENENYIADGALFTVKVKAFNQNGLHCLIGNVSEICQSGEIKGGNWNSLPSEVTKDSAYTLPDPRVGFRVVMEVIK